MQSIPLTKKKSALVDDDWFEYFSQFEWKINSTGYVVRVEGIWPYQKTIYMHREVLGAPNGIQINHLDTNKLNNQLSNLEPVRDDRFLRKGTSSYRGVHWSHQNNKWCATIKPGLHIKKVHLGLFTDELEAARAYDDAARKHHGGFARLNFPDQPHP